MLCTYSGKCVAEKDYIMCLFDIFAGAQSPENPAPIPTATRDSVAPQYPVTGINISNICTSLQSKLCSLSFTADTTL